MHSEQVVPDIPANLVTDFDYFAVEPENDDIHLGSKRLHEGPEIFYTPRNEGHWVFTRAEDIAEGGRDTERCSKGRCHVTQGAGFEVLSGGGGSAGARQLSGAAAAVLFAESCAAA